MLENGYNLNDFQEKVGIKFVNHCGIEDWLNSEYVEKIKLTYLEYGMLKELLKAGYKYITRDLNRSLYVSPGKPWKYFRLWKDENLERLPFDMLFKFVNWEDEEPRKIQEIVDNCEIVKE